MIQEFLELTAIDSISGQEREMADLLTVRLRELGFSVEEDDAGEKLNSSAGNLYAFRKGTGDPVLFSAHMDTVIPGIGKKAVVLEDRITSDKTTVLGADDASGIAEILAGIRLADASGRPLPDIEIIFSVREEAYTAGVKHFDYSKVRSKKAYVLDMNGPVGKAVLKAPMIFSFTLTVHGRSAHAGFEPEKGVNAIATASAAVTATRQGHLDSGVSLNIGTINGGSATNVVSERCVVTGEIRGFSEEEVMKAARQLRQTFEEEAAKTGASVEVESVVNISAFSIDPEEEVVRDFIKACEKIGIDPELSESFGASDNNEFVPNGLRGIVLSTGMENVHSVNEYIMKEDLVQGARLIEALLTL